MSCIETQCFVDNIKAETDQTGKIVVKSFFGAM
jgi:hypothetical protein